MLAAGSSGGAFEFMTPSAVPAISRAGDVGGIRFLRGVTGTRRMRSSFPDGDGRDVLVDVAVVAFR
jgi:hypothetical protein